MAAKKRKPRRAPRKSPRRPTKKATPKKAAKKKRAVKRAAKKAAKKASIVPTKKTIKAAVKNIRLQAAQDYIADPEGRSVRYHYERDDRDYQEAVTYDGFVRWSQADSWTDRRQQFWEEIEVRMLAHMRDEILQARFERLSKMKEAVSYAEEYMMPLRDPKTGEVLRHELTHAEYPGLPKYPLKLPSMEKFVRMIMEIQDKIRLDSGEAVTRSETLSSGKTKVSVTALDPVVDSMKLDPNEARSLARTLLRERFGDQMEDAEVLDGEVVEADAKRDVEDEDDDQL